MSTQKDDEEMGETAIDLGPGAIAGAYDIPSTDWEIANKRVSVILDPGKGPAALQAKLKALPNYVQLVSVSDAWKSTTFDGLVKLSTDLVQFSATTVESYLTVLGMIIDQLVDGDTSMKDTLDNTVDGFVSASSGYAAQAAALVPEMKAFDLQMTKSDITGSGVDDPIWNAFSLNAGLAFDGLQGRFLAIAGDLTTMKANIDQKIKDDLPIVVQIVDLKVAKERWESINRLSSGFVANAPAQRKYLDGEW